MKKCLILTVSIISSLLLTACGGSSNTDNAVVENGAFVSEPQSVIDQINASIENTNDSGEYFTCDDFEESGEAIHTSDDWSRIILTFETNDAGLITHCRLYWQNSGLNTNVLSSAGLYSGVITRVLSPSNADEITESMTSIIVAGEGEASFESDGVAVNFQSIAGKNWLDISVAEDDKP